MIDAIVGHHMLWENLNQEADECEKQYQEAAELVWQSLQTINESSGTLSMICITILLLMSTHFLVEDETDSIISLIESAGGNQCTNNILKFEMVTALQSLKTELDKVRH